MSPASSLICDRIPRPQGLLVSPPQVLRSDPMMFSRSLAFRMCLRSAVFVVAAVCTFATNRAHAQSGDSISPLSNVAGPGDSAPSADYVRKGTEPPRFDPNSPEAQAARAKAAASPPPKPAPATADWPATSRPTTSRPATSRPTTHGPRHRLAHDSTARDITAHDGRLARDIAAATTGPARTRPAPTAAGTTRSRPPAEGGGIVDVAPNDARTPSTAEPAPARSAATVIDSWGASDASTTPETPAARAPAPRTAPARPAATGYDPWANEPPSTPAPRSRKPAESERETAQAAPLTLPFGTPPPRAADGAVRVPAAARASDPGAPRAAAAGIGDAPARAATRGGHTDAQDAADDRRARCRRRRRRPNSSSRRRRRRRHPNRRWPRRRPRCRCRCRTPEPTATPELGAAAARRAWQRPRRGTARTRRSAPGAGAPPLPSTVGPATGRHAPAPRRGTDARNRRSPATGSAGTRRLSSALIRWGARPPAGAPGDPASRRAGGVARRCAAAGASVLRAATANRARSGGSGGGTGGRSPAGTTSNG